MLDHVIYWEPERPMPISTIHMHYIPLNNIYYKKWKLEGWTRGVLRKGVLFAFPWTRMTSAVNTSPDKVLEVRRQFDSLNSITFRGGTLDRQSRSL